MIAFDNRFIVLKYWEAIIFLSGDMWNVVKIIKV